MSMFCDKQSMNLSKVVIYGNNVFTVFCTSIEKADMDIWTLDKFVCRQ